MQGSRTRASGVKSDKNQVRFEVLPAASVRMGCLGRCTLSLMQADNVSEAFVASIIRAMNADDGGSKHL
jgi:hypothetical protein